MKTVSTLIPVVLALGASNTAFAQFTLEEVLVTAQKRTQSVQEVPISITALSGDFIDRKNILGVSDLENFTPGLRVPQQDAGKTFLRIRGVGSRKFDVGSEGSVGVFIDEVYIPRFSGADVGLLDLARVEVLKGPQGTIFGRNTAAGAISIVTQAPTQEFEAFIEAGAGNKDSHLVRGSVSGSVTDELSMRLAFGQSEEGGFQTNTNTGNSDDRTTTMIRLAALYEASDTLSIQTTVQYSEREQNALLQRNIATLPEGGALPLFASPLIVPITVNNDLRDYPMNHDGEIDNDALFVSVKIEKEFEDVSLVSITGYQDNEMFLLQDFEGSDANVGLVIFDEESDTFSQEFRLVGANWLAGVYYYEDDAFSDYRFNWFEDSLQSLVTGGRLDITDNAPIDVNTTSWAAFGEYTFELNDKLSLTVGGRYSEDEKDFTLAGETNQPGLPVVVLPYSFSDKEKWDSFDPKVSVSYQMADDLLIYASYNEGYKAGGVQFTAINQTLAEAVFDPEELAAFELGLKSDLLENTLRLNASVFYYDYEGLQVQRVDVALSGGIPAAVTQNAAESEVTGLEFDLTWLPTESLEVRLAYAYLDAEYKDFIGTGGQDFSGNPLPVSPENTVLLSMEYNTMLAGDWGLVVGTDWTWVDDYNFDVTDDDPFAQQEAYTVGGARLALVSPSESVTISAFVQNMTDEEFFSQATRRASEVIASIGEGRRYGVRVRYNF